MTNHLPTADPLDSSRNSVYISVRKTPGTRLLFRVIGFEDSIDPSLQDAYGDFEGEKATDIVLKLGIDRGQVQAVLAETARSSEIRRFRLELSGEQYAFLRRVLQAYDQHPHSPQQTGLVRAAECADPIAIRMRPSAVGHR